MLKTLFHNGKADGLVLGTTGRLGFLPRFRISEQVRQFHMYVVGLTGRGKSKFLQNCIVQDAMAGRGCAVIDPHGDLAKAVLKSLIAKGFFEAESALDRILYVSPRRRDRIIPFNVLARPDATTETYEICQRVIAAFMRTWSRTLMEPPRFQQIMRSSLATLVETKGTLPDLYALLTNDDFREQRLAAIPEGKVRQDVNAFFENEFNRWGRERPRMISSTTNKVSALIENPSIYYMLSQQENRIHIRNIMDEGKILLIDLGDCDDETKRLFGTLMVTGFEQAALSRARVGQSSRRPYYLYVDEFQDFACHPGAAETFSQMLSQVRKFGLHMILANQSIAQLNQGLQTALMNAQTLVSFRISRADADALSRVLGEVDIEAVKHEIKTSSQHPLYSPMHEQWESFIQHLTTLKVRQAIVKSADDRLASIYAEKIRQLPDDMDEKLEDIISKLLHRTGISNQLVYQAQPTAEVKPRLNTLFAY